MAPGKIDDAQPPVAKADSRTDEDASIIRPAMNHGLIHAVHHFTRNIRPAMVFENSADTAHAGLCSLPHPAASCDLQIQFHILLCHSIQAEVLDGASACSFARPASQRAVLRQAEQMLCELVCVARRE